MTRYCAKCSRGFPAEDEVCPHCGHSVHEPYYEEAKLLPEIASDDQVRPWLRFLARGFDFNLYVLVGWIFLLPLLLITNNIWFLVVVYIAFSFVVEAALLAWLGTTPGKWLGKIRIQAADGGTPTFAQALQRTLLMCFKGEGLFIPIVSFITMIIAYNRLNAKGKASWDEDSETTVVHGPVSAKHYWLLALSSVAIGVISDIINK